MKVMKSGLVVAGAAIVLVVSGFSFAAEKAAMKHEKQEQHEKGDPKMTAKNDPKMTGKNDPKMTGKNDPKMTGKSDPKMTEKNDNNSSGKMSGQ